MFLPRRDGRAGYKFENKNNWWKIGEDKKAQSIKSLELKQYQGQDTYYELNLVLEGGTKENLLANTQLDYLEKLASKLSVFLDVSFEHA